MEFETPSAQFSSALALWLDGNDGEALHRFSELAALGDITAQIFLGRIETIPHLHSHIINNFTRAQRIALLRSPGGLSGKSWLLIAAPRSTLATALFDIRRIDKKETAVLDLLEFGEIGTAAIPLSETRRSDPSVLLTAYQNGFLPEYANYLFAEALFYQWQRRGKMPDNVIFPETQDLYEISEFLQQYYDTNDQFLWQYFGIGFYEARPDLRSSLNQMAEQTNQYAPIRNYCQSNCPNAPIDCAVDFAAYASNGYSAWIKLYSPVEAIISTESYQTSPRFFDDVTRLMRDSTTNVAWLEQENSCLFEIVSE